MGYEFSSGCYTHDYRIGDVEVTDFLNDDGCVFVRECSIGDVRIHFEAHSPVHVDCTTPPRFDDSNEIANFVESLRRADSIAFGDQLERFRDFSDRVSGDDYAVRYSDHPRYPDAEG